MSEENFPPADFVNSTSPEVTFNTEQARVNYPNLKLTPEHPTSPEITITFKKRALSIVEGKSYGNRAVKVDGETREMQQLAQQAEALKVLPEIQRPAAVLELLKKNVQYATDEAIEAIAKDNPELAQWVSQNVGVKSIVPNIPLSEVFDKGKGTCRHLSPAYLWLIQKAGLQGTLCNAEAGVVKNIKRSDREENLFKSVAIGEPTAAHMWTEVQMNDGTWIPVDPSTNLVGDTQERMALFQEANYMASGEYGTTLTWSPHELVPQASSLSFKPGEAISNAQYGLLLVATPGIPNPNYSPKYSGPGNLTVSTTQRFGMMNLEILSAAV